MGWAFWETEVLGGEVDVVADCEGDVPSKFLGVAALSLMGGADVGAGVGEGLVKICEKSQC